MGGGHGHGGGGGGFHPHGPSRGVVFAADVLATSFWLFILFSAKERGPYTFGLRHPWHDHPTSPEYLSYHEQRWATEDAAQSLRNPGLGLPPGYDDDDHAPSAGEQRA